MISFRRFFLDQWLGEQQKHMKGLVLDIGGKRANPRGSFRPPSTKATMWQYVNMDHTTKPDYLCSADEIPLPSASVDCILMCEVLEHLDDPISALRETVRLLKPHGTLLASMPFLVPTHPDPDDFQRWTKSKLEKEISNCGLVDINIVPMGGVLASISDILRMSLVYGYFENRRLSKNFAVFVVRVAHALHKMSFCHHSASDLTTTGWGITAHKPG